MLALLLANCATARKYHVRPPAGNPLTFLTDAPQVLTVEAYLPKFIFGVGWCMGAAPIISTVIEGRELLLSELYVVEAGCIVPILGSILLRKYFDQHPEWKRWDETKKDRQHFAGGK